MLPVTVSCRVRTFLRASCDAGGRLSTTYYTAMTSEAFGARHSDERILIWAQESQRTLIGDLATVLPGSVVLASPRAGDATRLSEALDLPATDDVRREVIERGVSALLVMADEALSPDAAAAARDRGVPLFSLRPPMDLHDAEPASASPRFIPRFRHSRAMRSAAEALAEFGPREVVHVTCRGTPAMGPLAARLFDAMDVIDHLLEGAVQVDATHAKGGERRDAESLADLDGHLAAIIHFDGPAAGVVVSNRSPQWFREVSIIGPQGVFHLTDQGYGWVNQAGRVVEQQQWESPALHSLLAQAISRRRDDGQRDSAQAESERLRVLPLCEAARVSARTGQGESPQKLLQILSQV